MGFVKSPKELENLPQSVEFRRADWQPEESETW
jgi:hypothetical protein